ncbi:3'-5' exonuclease [Microbacterium indicum]|uniref:3'-5' exonuclease n=1 Tax=Microbacterium indicum TaxID=358100 RepID=UPI00146C9547|nr:3'-5' exonuclease [Microbacterium indicum]
MCASPSSRSLLDFVAHPSLNPLSPSYQQGTRLNDVIKEATVAFKCELEVDGDPIAALDRVSKEDTIRILTVHKCKGLEFEKVSVFGAELQFFWSDDEDVKAEFFVAISRANNELVLTSARQRLRLDGARSRWWENSPAHEEALGYTDEP